MTDASANTQYMFALSGGCARTPPYFSCVQRAAVKNRRATIAYYFSTDFRVQICFRVRRVVGLLSRRYINGVPRTGIYLAADRSANFFFHIVIETQQAVYTNSSTCFTRDACISKHT